MDLGRHSRASFLLAGAVIASSAALALPAQAQSAENVAVVINEDSPASQQIGEYYARVRDVPASNVLRIRTATEETIERDTYLSTIEQPLGLAIRRGGLQDRLLYLVLTKGVPLKIAGTDGLTGTQASVDSELTLLYRRLTGRKVTAAGRIDNPYFLGTRDPAGAKRFSHRDQDIYLVTRLDGFSVEDAIALVDRARQARPEGRFVLDQRAVESSRTPDAWLADAAARLRTRGLGDRVVLETTKAAAHNLPSVLGYFSWGSTDAANRVRRVGMAFTPGAIAANLTSSDARTFHAPPEDWQPTGSPERAGWFAGSGESLIGDLIREGVTGVSGQVGEAYVLGAVRPEILFPAYASGFNLAEAFYLAAPVLSWQTIVIGDPLTAPFEGRRLTAADIEDPTDARTGFPGLFSRRRIAALLALYPGVPDTAAVPVVRALAQIDDGNRSGAAAALRESVPLSPRVVEWLLYLGLLQERVLDFRGAVGTYQEVLKIQPAHVAALNNTAYALAVHLDAPAEALPLARRAATLAPQNGTVLDTLGWTEHLAGNDDDASKILSSAIRLEPGQGEIWLHAAIVYTARKMWDQSEVHLREALRRDPALESREDVRRVRQANRTGGSSHVH
jgi:uncharacterized protein (TIGR03790 family)